MPEYRFPNAARSIKPLVDLIKRDGDNVVVRGFPTIELRHVTIVIDDPTDCLMTNVGRKMNTKLAALEALQLISGDQYPELMRRVAPNTAQFLNGGAFHGAYGPRVRHQLDKIVSLLQYDPTSRQAVATIWDPAYDGNGDTPDTPCTVYLSFMVREDKLIMHTHMRSNDVWWGWTYDVAQFCSLQVHIATALQLELGEYVHFADSFHLYDRDVPASMELGDGSYVGQEKIRPLSPTFSKWRAQVSRAQEILRGEKLNDLSSSFLERMGVRIHNEA